MFSGAGFKILDILCTQREATAKELAAETGHSRKQVYRVVDSLLKAGLVDESRHHHNQRVVRATDNPVVEAYRHLISKFGHVDWPDLLSPATIRVCWYLDEPRRIIEIADRLGITRQAVYNAIDPLKYRAMLSPHGPEYALSDDLQPLHDFVQEAITHEHRTRVRDRASTATIEWCDPIRALVQVQTSEETDTLQSAADWEMTGLAKFHTYGLQFFLAGEPPFWYAPDEQLTPADIVCHTLFVEADSRRVSYAMLLIEQEQVPKDELIEAATWYGIEDLVTRMYRFIEGDIETNGSRKIRIPSPREYAALKEQYGVA